jgi:hypothetical protein
MEQENRLPQKESDDQAYAALAERIINDIYDLHTVSEDKNVIILGDVAQDEMQLLADLIPWSDEKYKFHFNSLIPESIGDEGNPDKTLNIIERRFRLDKKRDKYGDNLDVSMHKLPVMEQSNTRVLYNCYSNLIRNAKNLYWHEAWVIKGRKSFELCWITSNIDYSDRVNRD